MNSQFFRLRVPPRTLALGAGVAVLVVTVLVFLPALARLLVHQNDSEIPRLVAALEQFRAPDSWVHQSRELRPSEESPCSLDTICPWVRDTWETDSRPSSEELREIALAAGWRSVQVTGRCVTDINGYRCTVRALDERQSSAILLALSARPESRTTVDLAVTDRIPR